MKTRIASEHEEGREAASWAKAKESITAELPVAEGEVDDIESFKEIPTAGNLANPISGTTDDGEDTAFAPAMRAGVYRMLRPEGASPIGPRIACRDEADTYSRVIIGSTRKRR